MDILCINKIYKSREAQSLFVGNEITTIKFTSVFSFTRNLDFAHKTRCSERGKSLDQQ